MKRALAVLGGALAACSPSPHHTVHGVSPYQTGLPLGPFPNAWFEQPGEKTATGLKVMFPTDAVVLPRTSNGTPMNTQILGNVDGWSPATQIVVYFPTGVDGSQLTPSATSSIEDRTTLMTSSSSPIALVDVNAQQRIPIFAELDANATSGQRQGLLIHPQVRLKTSTRYAVAILTSLNDATGKPLAAEGQFQAWVQGKLSDSDPLWEVSDRLDADAKAFSALGISKTSLALAWDFDTASDASTTTQLLGMVSTALASVPKGAGFTATVTEPSLADDPNGFRIIQGTFEAPSFESGPDPSPLQFDANGVPVMGALASWSFSAVIPRCAAASPTPVPLLIVGHGLLGSASNEIAEDEPIFQSLWMIGIATDWKGLTSADLGVIGEILSNPNDFDLVTDRLQQAHVNFQVMTRLALNALATSPYFEINDQPSYDTSQVYYWGCSNGGIQGATYLALSPDVHRALLNVPGAEWTLLMWRSADFGVMLDALKTTYPDPLDLQNVIALTQSLWDKTDPIEFAPLLTGTSKQALFQESIGDGEVTNIATRTEMRTINAQGLAPFIQTPYDMTPANGPLSGLVYTQWSIDPMPYPLYENVPGPGSNQAHQAIRLIPEAQEQMKQFLTTGQVSNPCSGQCLFPGETDG